MWLPLPDARHSLGLQHDPGTGVRRAVVGSLETEDPRYVIGPADAYPVLSSEGHVLFLRNDALLAQPFDTDRLEVAGDAFPVAEAVSHGRWEPGMGIVSVSLNGVLAYRPAPEPAESRIAWFDRKGRELGVLDEGRSHSDVAIAPDGRRALVSARSGTTGTPELWLYDMARAGVRTRLRTGSDPRDRSASPVWSPDGRRVAFVASRQVGSSRTIETATTSTAAETVLMEGPDYVRPTSWSPDGHLLLQRSSSYKTTDPIGGGSDLWVLPPSGERQPTPFLEGPSREENGQFSPDGRFVAFQSDESGASEVYVVPFPGPGPKVVVSAGGGRAPRWGPDGREIFYLDLDNTLQAASVAVEGDRLEVGAVRALFRLRPPQGRPWQGSPIPYDVSADGQRFLVIDVEREPEPAPITVVLNWAAGLTE